MFTRATSFLSSCQVNTKLLACFLSCQVQKDVSDVRLVVLAAVGQMLPQAQAKCVRVMFDISQVSSAWCEGDATRQLQVLPHTRGTCSDGIAFLLIQTGTSTKSHLIQDVSY